MHMEAKLNKTIETTHVPNYRTHNKTNFYCPIVLLPKGIYLVFHLLWWENEVRRHIRVLISYFM